MKKETKKKKKVAKVSKKKVKVAPVIEEQVVTDTAPETAPESCCDNNFNTEAPKNFSLASNLSRQSEFNNQVRLVMAFNPQITVVDGRAHVVIGSDLNALTSEGASVFNAMIKMFDLLTK